MQYISFFDSPVGKLYLTADEQSLKGVYFEREKGNSIPIELNDVEFSDNHPVIMDTKLWLSLYFNGSVPDFVPNISLSGTEFSQQVWEVVKQIPYGQSMSYGEIAQIVAHERGTKPSAQAVGSAVGNNPIPIIIPCHRVLAAGKFIGGYSGGINNKKFLLDLEQIQYNFTRWKLGV